MSTDALLFQAKVAFMFVSPVSGRSPEASADWEHIRSRIGLGLDTPTRYNPTPQTKLLPPILILGHLSPKDQHVLVL